jgi:hypothetical protein
LEVGTNPLERLGGIGGWLDRLPPNLGDIIADVATVVGVVVVCAFAIFLTWREIMTSRALQPHRRGRYLVRATGTNEWSKEDLERWGSQLTTIRRRVRRIQDRPAHAVRVRLAATRNGVLYTMEASWRFEKVMRNPSLPGVAITRLRPRPQPDTPTPSSDPPSTTGARR